MEHILTECGMTEDAVDGPVDEALTAVELIRGEKAEATVEARLKAAFREIGYENDNERKVHKVMGKLHDDNVIRRVLSDQRAAIQTHAALPIVHTSAPPHATCSSVAKPLGIRARHVAVIDKLRVFMTRGAGAGSYRGTPHLESELLPPEISKGMC